MIHFGYAVLIRRSVDMYLSVYRYLRSHQGSNPPLTNFSTHPLGFITAYKSYDVLPVLAGTSDSKNPEP